MSEGHAVLEHDAADDDGRGGRKVADESHRRGRGRGVVLGDPRLEGQEWGFEEEAGAQAGDELEADDLAQRGGGRRRGEVDVEAVADSEEGHPEPDQFEVAPRAADGDAGDDGHQGFRDHDGEDEET